MNQYYVMCRRRDVCADAERRVVHWERDSIGSATAAPQRNDRVFELSIRRQSSRQPVSRLPREAGFFAESATQWSVCRRPSAGPFSSRRTCPTNAPALFVPASNIVMVNTAAPYSRRKCTGTPLASLSTCRISLLCMCSTPLPPTDTIWSPLWRPCSCAHFSPFEPGSARLNFAPTM